MSKIVPTQSSSPNEDNKPNVLEDPQKQPLHLKLVVSNPSLPEKKELSKPKNLIKGFTVEIQKSGHFNYSLTVCDYFHFLECEILLEIHENDEEELGTRSVICYFPDTLGDELSELVWEDETLYSMILVNFQVRLLKHLLLFCSDYNVLNLIIDMGNTPESYNLEICRYIAKYEDKIPTGSGVTTQMVIPITLKTFDQWLKLMDKVSQDFRCKVWNGQSSNPVMRAYIKSNPCLKLF